jgi:broad specificity phosphatase PhoE
LTRLLLVRHGETALNSSQRFWGKTDVELGFQGLRQAESLRDRLANVKIDFVYSSKLKRTVITAETLISNRNLEVIKCPQLNEIDFGELEGLDFTEINSRYPEINVRWMRRDPELKYPGGESLPQMEARVREFSKILDRHSLNDTILIVAHSAIIRTLICQLIGLDMSYRWSLQVDLASLSIIETYSNTSILCLLNDVSHLNEGVKK